MGINICDIDNGHVGSQGSVYYEHDVNAGPLPGDTFKEILKGVATGAASRYMVEHNISNHFQCIADINTTLANNGIGSIAVKGGLALRIVLDTILNQWARDARSNERALLQDAREYMMHTYASPSDLDTGLYVSDPARLGEALSLARDELVRLRDSWTVKDFVLQDIVGECNAMRDEAMAALKANGLDVVAVNFIANKQADQDIQIVDPSNDNECPFSECNRVTLHDTHSIFISDNSGLVFKKGHNIADFHLIRAKWAVAAEITKTDGSVCTVNCPAELIDIAAPRSLDSRAPLSMTKGLHNMKTYVNAAGVKLPAVNLKFQMLDIVEMVKQAMHGANDPKVGKRINRLIIMGVLKSISGYNTALLADDEYELEKYDTFLVSDRWQDLMLTHTSNTDLVECVEYIETLENAGAIQLDTRLLQYLVMLRNVYAHKPRTSAMLFNATGGNNNQCNLVTGLACIGLTMMMGMFPR